MGLLSSLFGGSKTVTNPDQVWQQQQPFLLQNFGAGQGLAQQQMGQIGQTAFPLAQQLGQQGQQFLGGLGQNAGQQLNPFMGQGAVGPQIGALAGILGQQFNDQLTGINAGAAGAGGIGSARSGLAAGRLGAGFGQNLAMGAADIMQSDLLRRQQAATAQAGLQGQTALGGLSQLGSMFNLGISPFAAQFQPLQQQAGILGGPTVLGQGGTSTRTGGIIPGLSGLAGPALGFANFAREGNLLGQMGY